MKSGRGKAQPQVFSTTSLKNPRHAEHILVYHAMTGCDTTSALFGHGKVKIASLLDKNPNLQVGFSRFQDSSATQNKIALAGERILVSLYNGRPNDTLSDLGYAGFARSLTKSKYNLAS
nr:unnamed protein product [Callosobruchus analis]